MGRFNREQKRRFRESSEKNKQKKILLNLGTANATPQKKVQNNFADDWQEYRKKHLPKKINDLTFHYQGIGSQKQNMAEALVLWEFIRNKFRPTSYRLSYKKELISQLETDSSNSYVRKVLAIESLPTAVWRKLLWKENINFDSYEACLRRMSEKQLHTIQDNFNDFSTRKIPRVFTWFDKVFRGVSYEKLSHEATSEKNRYVSKGSMSYNLLNLDFGFNAYPNGENNDYKIVEFSPLKFLSVKNHADDFIVNTEDGKYWRMYKSARSNFAFFPHKTVNLKTHICPGFWLTLILHFLFWIVSPIATACLLPDIIQGNDNAFELWRLAIFPVALITPLWLLNAVGRSSSLLLIWCFNSELLNNLIDCMLDKTRKYCKKHKDILIGLMQGTLIGLLTLSIIYIIFPLAYVLLGVGGVILVIMVLYSWCSGILNEEIGTDMEFKRWLYWPMLTLALGLIIYKFHQYLWIAALFVYDCLSYLWEAIMIAYIPILVTITILSPAFFCYLWLKRQEHKTNIFGLRHKNQMLAQIVDNEKELFADKLERRYYQFEKIITCSMLSAFLILFGTCIYLSDIDILTTTITLLILAGFIGITLHLTRTTKTTFFLTNPKTKNYYYLAERNGKKNFGWIKLARKNSWMETLNSQKQEEVFKFIKTIANAIEKDKFSFSILFVFMLKNIDQKSYQELEKLALFVRNVYGDTLDFSFKHRSITINKREIALRYFYFEIIKIVLNEEISFEKAKEQVVRFFYNQTEKQKRKAGRKEKRMAKNKIRLKKLLSVLCVIFFPLIVLFKLVVLIVKVAKKLIIVLLTLKRLFQFFNKLCPYVAKSKVLD